jgi:hypothetical protein
MFAATATPAAAIASTSGWVAAALWLAAAGLALTAFIRVHGTTLRAPAVWAVCSALVLAAVEAVLAYRAEWSGTFGADLALYAAAVGTFCPPMAVLGAKRPQDRGWQWIVLSLWIVLLVPAGQAWAAASGAQLHLPLAWSFMLLTLGVGGYLNHTFTRWAPTALAYTVTQACLLVPWTGGSGDRYFSAPWALVIVAAWQTWTRHPSDKIRSGEALTSFNQRWLAFRDGWGSFWGLRVKNRVNETASLSNWPVRLEWSGFVANDRGAPPEIDQRVAAQIQQAMDSLLWRFERIDKPKPDAPPASD